jgi:hypothetical protein
VAVQPGTIPRRGVHHDDGDACAEVVALELARLVAERRVVQVDDAFRVAGLHGRP